MVGEAAAAACLAFDASLFRFALCQSEQCISPPSQCPSPDVPIPTYPRRRCAIRRADALGAPPDEISVLQREASLIEPVHTRALEGLACPFTLLRAKAVIDAYERGELRALPCLDELRLVHASWLEARTIEFAAACRGEYSSSVLAVSHVWHGVEPDPTNGRV